MTFPSFWKETVLAKWFSEIEDVTYDFDHVLMISKHGRLHNFAEMTSLSFLIGVTCYDEGQQSLFFYAIIFKLLAREFLHEAAPLLLVEERETFGVPTGVMKYVQMRAVKGFAYSGLRRYTLLTTRRTASQPITPAFLHCSQILHRKTFVVSETVSMARLHGSQAFVRIRDRKKRDSESLACFLDDKFDEVGRCAN